MSNNSRLYKFLRSKYFYVAMGLGLSVIFIITVVLMVRYYPYLNKTEFNFLLIALGIQIGFEAIVIFDGVEHMQYEYARALQKLVEEQRGKQNAI